MNYQIEKKDLPALLQQWMQIAQVFAPVKVENFTQFKILSNTNELVLNGPLNTRYPPKSLFLPQSEVLLKYQDRDFTTTTLDKQQRIIFGIRPCDAHAVTLLDTVFDDQDNPDPYWKTRREQTTLVGLGCNEPRETCFCTTVGSGPFNKLGLDILITSLDDVYTLEVITEKGAQLVADLPSLKDDNQQQMLEVQDRALDYLHPAFECEGIKEKLYNIFESEYWQQVSQSCLGCGVCTFLCPTCFCFDIVDETQRGERVRNWDTCMFRIYSQEASGHNPRPTRSERTRQRIMHKYAYWLDQIEQIGCTGCGRCIHYCPVGIDIREMIGNARVWREA